MHRAYFSSVLQPSADSVWNVVRDFNDYPRYIDGVTDSLIEDRRAGDEVGAVRRFCYGGSWIRQRLTAHSDAERYFRYAGLEPFPYPGHSTDSVAAIDYAGTLRITPIVDGDRAFVEWFVDYECPAADASRWQEMLMDLIPQWVDSLRRVVAAEPATSSGTRPALA